MIVYVLGAGIVCSLALNRFLCIENKKDEKVISDLTRNYWDKEEEISKFKQERSQLLENINELREENRYLIKENDESQKCWDELKKINDQTQSENLRLCKISKETLDALEKREGQIGFADITIKNLEQKLNETREQLKLEDEASCKIIKDLEEEIEKERALNQTYSGYIKYILNAPRAVRRRFVNGECIDWYDENGVLRMKIKEEK